MPHVILSQGNRADRAGTIMTARFIEEHWTQLIQEAISAPAWMCGSAISGAARRNHQPSQSFPVTL